MLSTALVQDTLQPIVNKSDHMYDQKRHFYMVHRREVIFKLTRNVNLMNHSVNIFVTLYNLF